MTPEHLRNKPECEDVVIRSEQIFRPTIASADDQERCGSAVFDVRHCSSHRVAVAVIGEVDAINGRELGRYVARHTGISRQLILDLRAVDFFGSLGFTALYYISVHCARSDVDWAIVGSPAVRRLLSICDPEGELPLAIDLATALTRLDRLASRRLRFVWTSKTGWRAG
ncbi:STAS domain-containing protein [Mycolicibacterium iranicum]|uniref:Anti-anti-sigma factor n=1 Tax=Mycolicibacterium iranicum TaxID=912594 RepID=A0A178LYQ2_MYCIR|nr:STAS domain-containing protein [Mycolicibacterium iranicum]OAN39959.1 anti-anti-sigma factor [Mycolicibacterium iranicum]